MSEEQGSNNKLMCILCYLGILWLIPMLTDAKNDATVKFHINQGIVLTLFAIALSIVTPIPVIGWIVGLVGWVACAVFFIMGIINASKLEQKELPIIGKIKIYK